MTERIDRLNRVLAGRYRVERQLGEGGMATVYLADDLRHERKVALKVLKPELAAVIGAERFLAEIKMTANLQHPHILPLFDSGEADGFLFYVMPYVEGESLRERITREGPLAVDSAWRLLREVADGLAYAHAQGLIHRDIKPANILVSGRHAMIADFGVAKAVSGSAIRADYTATGIAVGTPKYMAPEQASGDEALDAAVDIYAFGVLAYEALSGDVPFRGSTPQQVLARQLTEDATPIDEVRRDLPRDLAALVMRCLARDPRERWPSAGELAEELERLSWTTGLVPAASASRPRRRASVTFVLGLAIGTGTLALLLYSQREQSGVPMLRLQNIRPVTQMAGEEAGPSLSPDGAWVAFTAQASGNRDIWIKRIDGGEPIQISDDPADDYDPSWSPDGSTIVFRSDRLGGGLYTVPAYGGNAVRLVDFGYRPRWSPDGTKILFTKQWERYSPNWVYVVDYPPSGEPTMVTDSLLGPRSNAEWLPDGSRILYRARGGIAIRSLDPDGAEEVMIRADSALVPSIWDGPVERPALPGDTLRGFNAVWVEEGPGLVFSRGYALSYAPLNERLRVVSSVAQVTTGNPQVFDDFSNISRDGSRLAFASRSYEDDIWKVELDPATGHPIGEPIRVTNQPGWDRFPALLPDGEHFLFGSNRHQGCQNLYVADTDGGNVRLVDSSRCLEAEGPIRVSPDGRWVVVEDTDHTNHLLPFDPVRNELTGPGRAIANGLRHGMASTWTPDGRYVRADSMIEDPTGAAPLVRALDVWPAYRGGSNLSFSPDGEWAAQWQVDAELLYLRVLRAGSDQPHFEWEGVGRGATWLGDPERIHVWGRLWNYWTVKSFGFVPFDPASGEVRGDLEMLDLNPVPGGLRFAGASLSVDRRWLFFGYYETQGDIYVADVVWDR